MKTSSKHTLVSSSAKIAQFLRGWSELRVCRAEAGQAGFLADRAETVRAAELAQLSHTVRWSRPKALTSSLLEFYTVRKILDWAEGPVQDFAHFV